MPTLTQDQLAKLATTLRAGEYNLLIGAGLSLGSVGGDGNPLPTGEELRIELCQAKGARSSASLQRVFELLDETEVKSTVTDRFSNTVPGPAVLRVPTFPWRRIFTLNVDDAIEIAYENGTPLQIHEPLNFKDVYKENRDLAAVPVIHLHGYARRSNDGYVFSRTEYVNMMSRGNSWMSVLADLMAVEPFIVIGTALDEPDLDFYLARRNALSSRPDKGPGIFVEPYPDAVTRKDCEKHDLYLFEDTAESFFSYIDASVRLRVPPVDLVAQASGDLFPPNVDRISQAKFLADFEIVPSVIQPLASDPRFLLGHEPTWNDLEAHLDVARIAGQPLLDSVKNALVTATSSSPKVIFYPDDVGGGKSTLVRRVAFDLARTGYRVLNCSALGRLEPAFTASMIDLVDDPLVVVVDNFADQVGPIADIVDAVEKVDIVFLCTERRYRTRYLGRALASVDVIEVKPMALEHREAQQLVETYVTAGMIGSAGVAQEPRNFASQLAGEPIAVACCRILNDFQPLDRIVGSVLTDATPREVDRYLVAALAQFCINGGIRYDILVAATEAAGLREQLEPYVSLSLTYSVGSSKNYIVPLNGVIGDRVLEHSARSDPERMLRLFTQLGKTLAPRVNRETIKRRTPEARLAGRLFDFDQVTEHFLGDLAANFYSNVQREWQWNSRYWEQVSLLNLGRFYKAGDSGAHYLEAASQHARHAVSIERHPFPLTTLGKVLFAETVASSYRKRAVFDEALARLGQAIDLERQWNWNSTQAYMIVFRGVLDALAAGLALSSRQAEDLSTYVKFVRRRFRRDRELQDARAALEERFTV